KVTAVVPYTNTLGFNFPIFLDISSWGDAECVTDPKVLYESGHHVLSSPPPQPFCKVVNYFLPSKRASAKSLGKLSHVRMIRTRHDSYISRKPGSKYVHQAWLYRLRFVACVLILTCVRD
ncbi:hypothetical protein HD554DRAFT_2023685, partial [Boletus coccyginus]